MKGKLAVVVVGVATMSAGATRSVAEAFLALNQKLKFRGMKYVKTGLYQLQVDCWLASWLAN